MTEKAPFSIHHFPSLRLLFFRLSRDRERKFLLSRSLREFKILSRKSENGVRTTLKFSRAFEATSRQTFIDGELRSTIS
jgi:hypothetical protein